MNTAPFLEQYPLSIRMGIHFEGEYATSFVEYNFS